MCWEHLCMVPRHSAKQHSEQYVPEQNQIEQRPEEHDLRAHPVEECQV